MLRPESAAESRRARRKRPRPPSDGHRRARAHVFNTYGPVPVAGHKTSPAQDQHTVKGRALRAGAIGPEYRTRTTVRASSRFRDDSDMCQSEAKSLPTSSYDARLGAPHTTRTRERLDDGMRE